MGFGGGSGELMSPEALFPAAADGDGDADDEGCEEAVGGVSEPPPPMPEVPSVPQLLEQLTAPTAPPSIEQHPPLPDKLSDIMKKK